MNNGAPRYARATDLDVNVAEDGLVVFNPVTDRVHHLSYTAGTLFELCEDRHSAAELAALMAKLYMLDEPPAEATETGLKQLLKEGLLVEVHDR